MTGVTSSPATLVAPLGPDGVARLRDGDERALEHAYREHGPAVRGYVRRFVPADEADDVTQQTFIELWRSRDRIDPSRPLVGFILDIARKRSIDHLRRRRHDVVSVDSLRELAGTNGDDVIDRIVWASEVERALSNLAPEQREALVLSYFGDLTQREIAQRLGVPVGTVKARMARGMQRMASMIDQGEVR